MLPYALRLLAIVTALTVALPVVVTAQDTSAVEAIVARMSTDPRSPDAYSANVKLHVKLHVFPFIGLTLNGKTTYQRPGLYHFVFHGLPRVADKFDDLRYDLGDAHSWPERYDVALAPQSTPESPALRLTPKKPGLVAYLDVFTDAQTGRIEKAVWSRHDHGTITLVQTYRAVGSADIVERQTATVDIPHMRAELTADYTGFALTPLNAQQVATHP